MLNVADIQAVGDQIAIRWSDDREDFFPMDRLRALSPSAETQGETDLLGNPISGDQKGVDFTGVTINSWQLVGGYAILFHFSDGHKTGLYSYEYLRTIGDVDNLQEPPSTSN
ncbi:MAG: DUF971 domain-containing protein [Verrucomicrobiota bacterium]